MRRKAQSVFGLEMLKGIKYLFALSFCFQSCYRLESAMAWFSCLSNGKLIIGDFLFVVTLAYLLPAILLACTLE